MGTPEVGIYHLYGSSQKTWDDVALEWTRIVAWRGLSVIIILVIYSNLNKSIIWRISPSSLLSSRALVVHVQI
jgi:hypothetical protein